jgi:hypothetical protein
MAITAHWITAAASTQNPVQRATLTMCADLIGFIYIPGWHTGEHLAHAFLHTLDHIHVTEKVVLLSNHSIKALLIPISYIDRLGNFRQCVQQQCPHVNFRA